MPRAKTKVIKAAQAVHPFTHGYVYKDDAGNEVAGTAERIAFEIVGDMEDDLCAVRDLVHAVALLAEGLHDQREATAVQRLAWTIEQRIDAAEEKRCKIFRITNPSRPAVAQS